MSTVDDIKAKLDIVEVLREQGVQLAQAGQSFKARCPFHNEKTPSFIVNPHKQVWFCFGCSKGGDLLTFVQEREGLEFGEALKLLAERAGVKLEVRDPRLEGVKTRSLSVLDAATSFFQRSLERSEVAQAYIARRQIAPAMVAQFAVGYAPDAWDTLTTHLLQQGFRAQEVMDAGLAVPGKRAGSAYDRFRHRLMFPIHDANARVVGFTGRILDGGTSVGDAPAKYVNTPETSVYKKSAVLYGLAFARAAIRSQGYAVLVEGQMDVVSSHGAGLAQTLATSGTALTEQQLRLLKRYTSTLHVAFDADPAGEGAAERGIDAALDAGFDVRVIVTPRDASGALLGKDADECIARDAGAWRAAVVAPVPVLDYYLARVRERYDCTTPAGKRDAGRALVAHLGHIADPIERAAWVRRSAEAIGIPENAVREAVVASSRHGASPRSARPAPGERAAPPGRHPVGSEQERIANRLFALAVRYPGSAAEAIGVLHVDNFSTDIQRELYNVLRIRYTDQERHRAEENVGSTALRAYIERLELFADSEFAELQTDAIQDEIARHAQKLRRMAIEAKLRTIAEQLRHLEQSAAGDRAQQTSEEELHALERAFHSLRNELATLHASP